MSVLFNTYHDNKQIYDIFYLCFVFYIHISSFLCSCLLFHSNNLSFFSSLLKCVDISEVLWIFKHSSSPFFPFFPLSFLLTPLYYLLPVPYSLFPPPSCLLSHPPSFLSHPSSSFFLPPPSSLFRVSCLLCLIGSLLSIFQVAPPPPPPPTPSTPSTHPQKNKAQSRLQRAKPSQIIFGPVRSGFPACLCLVLCVVSCAVCCVLCLVSLTCVLSVIVSCVSFYYMDRVPPLPHPPPCLNYKAHSR